MTLRLASLVSSLAVAALAGCYTGSSVDTNRAPVGPVADRSGTEPAPDASTKKQAAKAQGLPCDVQAILSNACGSCHGDEPSGGASSSLVTYEHLAAKSDVDPTKTVAQIALSRMKSQDRPMPPEGRLGAASIAVLDKWVKAGLPKGTCGEIKPQGGAGQSEGEGEGEGEGQGEGEGEGQGQEPEPVSVCTNGTPLSSAADAALMHPGKDCIGCHKSNKVDWALFPAVGTVYPTLHEPDACRGANDGLKVVIIDATGNIHTADVNGNGNFRIEETFPTPYRALVVRGTSMREMKTPQTNGNCNACHTEWGKGAPGRVMAP